MIPSEGTTRSRAAVALRAFVVCALVWLGAARPAEASAGHPDTFAVSGPVGGPFAPKNGSIDLVNPWAAPLRWHLLGNSQWLESQNLAGSIPSLTTRTLPLSIDEAYCATLAAGSYTCRFTAMDPAGDLIALATCELTVLAPSGQITVDPAEAFALAGQQGGSFSPLSKTYTLANVGSLAMAWQVVFDDTWVFAAGSNGGALQPGQSQGVTLQVNATWLASLPVGQLVSHARFIDAVTGAEFAVRDVVIDVSAPPSGNGWTTFTPSADSRLVYVSPSGNDGNSGLSASAPKQSIAAGRALLREGYPDWLLLQKGGTWDYSFGTWTLSGRSATEPMLISSYGAGARPLLRTGGGAGVMTVTATGGSAKITDVAFVGLHFLANGYNGTSGQPTGFALLQTVENFLIEDCRVEGYRDSCVFTGGNPSSHRNIRMRRSLFLDNYSINNGFSQGMICAAVDGLLIEECLFDRCGVAQPSGFNHAIYIDNEGNKNIVVRGNIVSDAASHGLQLRPGGVAEDNLFVRTSIALQVGGGDSWQVNGNGVTGLVRRNVILDGKNIDGSNLRGWGILLQNIASIQVEDNVIANAPAAGNPRPIELDGWSTSHKIYDTTLRGNVVSGWGGAGLRVKGQGGSEIKNLVIDDNEVQNLVDANHLIEIDNSSATGEITSLGNDFYSAALSANAWFLLGGGGKSLATYKAAVGDTTSSGQKLNYGANATLAGYHASLGKPATHAAFIAEARKQSKDNWRNEYTSGAVNNWIRAAFGK